MWPTAGLIPDREWRLWSGDEQRWQICPAAAVCVRTLNVSQLWRWQQGLVLAALASWLLSALALAAVAAFAPRVWLRDHGAEGAVNEIHALARRIREADSYEDVTELRGRSAAVSPDGKVKVLVTVTLALADFFLDLYTMYTMLCNGDLIFAACLMVTSAFSSAREFTPRSLLAFPGEVAKTLRNGVTSDGLQRFLESERGTEALVSLFISAYALPFTIKTPLQAIICPLSVLSSVYGLATFLHEEIDLAGSPTSADEEEEDPDGSDTDTEGTDSISTADSFANAKWCQL
eukprot:CAMPEP_0204575560 /NCGR_PEP_ID=MMETSP0661-20131031/41266_1 /ASSEMBLY_ACC=CAM_ASM_000606 /TAXON_ID=109239 /ORGANISM="Alexandrium margalefi, Strain AMGDE01CS-322" /LENGTH=289 /DNA_ID=CAMNT_0051584211 /DNA_START=11 /DNA_END=880 /DNA_ORIENTATION=-